DGAFECSRGGQASAERDVPVKEDTTPADGMPGFPERPGDPGRIAGPSRHGSWFEIAERGLRRLVRVLHGPKIELEVAPPRHVCDGSLRQRDRQHVAVV